ncbi:MAG TPA: hypothetical protein GXX41_12975 [Thermoanaerobacterium sp.]|nr:hypothetical protein [Thermoanaerobacterium sp.]
MKRKSIVFLITTVMMFTMMGSLSAFADDRPVITTLEAPQIIAVNVKTHVNGSPYFEIKWKNPQSIKELFAVVDEIGEAPLDYLLDTKIGDRKWRSEMGETISGNSLHGGDMIMDFADYDPINSGELDTIDIKANVYRFRVQYAYLNSIDEEEYYTYSPFSNIVSIGAEAFYKEASNWAKPELQKANDLGLIPDILKGADMTKPITREEFAELAVVLYERVTDKKSEPVSPNPFTDTANPQILKAYNLGITSGTSQTTFSPKVLINREQCAAMLFRAIKAIHPQGDYSIAGVKDFPDQKHISSWAVEATKYMNKIGVIAGDAQGNFMPKATTPAQEAAGYGMATREQAIALSVRTHDKAPEIKASSTNISNPDPNSLRKAADSGGRLPADIIAGLPGWLPNWFLDIPIAADAEFGALGGIYPTSDDMITIGYMSDQTLEALYYLYYDFMKGLEDFFTYKQDDGKAYYVRGIKDGWEIDISVALSGGNLVGIQVKPHEDY